MTVERALCFIAGAFLWPSVCSWVSTSTRTSCGSRCSWGVSLYPVRVYQLVSDDGDPTKGRPDRRHWTGEHDDFCVWVHSRDLTTHPQSVDMGQVEVDDNHVGLESLRGV